MKDCMEDFARAILRAQQIREESYVLNDKETDGNYTIDHYESADKAASELGFDKRATQPIYLLNLLAWNDIQAWAQEQTNDGA